MLVAMTSELRAEIRALGPRTRGQRYPVELRRRIASAAHAFRADGLSWQRIGEAFGIWPVTLRRWCDSGIGSAASVAAPLVAVQVVGDRGEVSVVSPQGWRIEGLSLSDAASLLRSLS